MAKRLVSYYTIIKSFIKLLLKLCSMRLRSCEYYWLEAKNPVKLYSNIPKYVLYCISKWIPNMVLTKMFSNTIGFPEDNPLLATYVYIFDWHLD